MRILVVTNMWPTATRPNWGIFVKEQVASLKKAGLAVEVLFIDGSGTRKHNYVALPILIRNRLRSFNADIIHAHYGLTGAFCALRSPRPLVVTYHGSDVHLATQARFSRFASRRSAANVCVSQSLGSELKAPNTHLIPCGVDTSLFRPDSKSAVRERLGLDPSAELILFGGNKSNPAKNYGLFAQVLARSRRPNVQELILSGVPREKVPDYMNAADVLLLTSHYEGYALVVTEAIACGLPVISVPVGNISDRIAMAPPSAIVERDPDKIAKVMDQILEPAARIDPVPQLLGLTATDVADRLKNLYRSICR